MMDLFSDINIPPAVAETKDVPDDVAVVTADAAESAPLRQIMPDGFDLRALLTFLPDVRMKRALEELAAQASTIDVTTDFGLRRADTLLVQIRDQMRAIEGCFDVPATLSNQLHKRVTGLRADFLQAGVETSDSLARRIKAQQRENERRAEEERRRIQAEEDQRAREQAAAAVEEAKRMKQPKAVIKELAQQAATATAPPVQVPVSSALRQNKVAPNWKACPVGTTDDDEPNPEMALATPAQLEGIKELMKACIAGTQPMTLFEVRWPPLNTRAVNERTAMKIPGIEARDVGRLTRRRTRG